MKLGQISMIQEYLNSQSNSFSRSFPNHNSLMSSFTENACEFYQYYIIIMRRHARKNTIFGITGSDSDFGLLQSKKLTNVRSCLKKGYEGATLTEQNGLLQFLTMTFPQFQYIYKKAPDRLISFLKHLQLKIYEVDHSLLNEDGQFENMYIVISGKVIINIEEEYIAPSKQCSHKELLDDSLTREQRIQQRIIDIFMDKKKQDYTQEDVHAFNMKKFGFNKTLKRTSQLNTEFFPKRKGILYHQSVPMRSTQMIDNQQPETQQKIVGSFTLLGDKTRTKDGRKFSKVSVQEDYTEMIHTPIEIFYKTFYGLVEIQEIKERAETLKQLDLFKRFTRDKLSDMVAYAQVITLERNAILYNQNDRMDWENEERKRKSNEDKEGIFLYILNQGSLSLSHKYKLALSPRQQGMKKQSKVVRNEVCIVNKNSIIGLEEIIKKLDRRLYTVKCHSNSSQIYKIPLRFLGGRDIFISVINYNQDIFAFIKQKMDVEDQITQQMINRKLKTIYNQETKDNKDELENLVDKKHKNLISLQNSKFALKQQNEVFNMTKEFYNVKTHCGSQAILQDQVKSHLRHATDLGFSKESKDESKEIEKRRSESYATYAYNRYLRSTINYNFRKNQSQSIDRDFGMKRKWSIAVKQQKRLIKKSRREQCKSLQVVDKKQYLHSLQSTIDY